jgi:prohibitin 1
MAQRVLGSLTTLGLGAVVAGTVAEFCLYDVDAGTRAVIFDKFRGIQETVVQEGTHFRIPFIQVN